MTVSIPVWTLLLFAAWTVLSMGGTVGGYRWSRILRGRSKMSDFAEYAVKGAPWYKRSLRAHANCVENLPVYAAIVVFIVAADIHSTILDGLSIVFISGRVVHTLVHVTFEQVGKVVLIRFIAFALQLVCMLAMIGVSVLSVSG